MEFPDSRAHVRFIPLPRVHAIPLIREVDGSLLDLLGALAPGEWDRRAGRTWTVRDVAAHLLDTSLRRLSLDRDRQPPPTGEHAVRTFTELVDFLDDLNATWIAAARRLSPATIVDLLAHVQPQVTAHFETLDPDAAAPFPVSWAGEDADKAWLDVAREYTEKWHHQQQIREAVGAPGIDTPHFLAPLLGTFARALPRAYEEAAAPPGTTVLATVPDVDGCSWLLERTAGRWRLRTPDPAVPAAAAVRVPAATARRVFTASIDAAHALRAATTEGPDALTSPFFRTVAVMRHGTAR
jgi:uncharacterized protein (TIGR03083 family)